MFNGRVKLDVILVFVGERVFECTILKIFNEWVVMLHCKLFDRCDGVVVDVGVVMVYVWDVG